MPRYDFKCEKCEHVWEDTIPASELKDYAPECPECNSNFTKMVWLTAPKTPQTKDPYDLLDKGEPGGKIFSGPSISSKTTT
jgi:putative FmdB family regulatory protein